MYGPLTPLTADSPIASAHSVCQNRKYYFCTTPKQRKRPRGIQGRWESSNGMEAPPEDWYSGMSLRYPLAWYQVPALAIYIQRLA